MIEWTDKMAVSDNTMVWKLFVPAAPLLILLAPSAKTPDELGRQQGNTPPQHSGKLSQKLDYAREAVPIRSQLYTKLSVPGRFWLA
jgi:hypothetical protein